MRYITILVLILSVFQAEAGEFWTDDKLANTLMVASNTLIVIDWGQTRESADKGYEEVGHAKYFIGENPTTGQVNRYFVASLLTYNTINYLLPTKWKKWYSGGVAAFQLYVVEGNYSVGVGIKF